jgi:hypothetical protein
MTVIDESGHDRNVDPGKGTNVFPGKGFDAVERDITKLLQEDISYEGWFHKTAQKKAFYVRGFTWFRERVIAGKVNIYDIPDEARIKRMKEIIESRPEWKNTPLNWNEDFGFRQFIDSASPKVMLTPKFQKAVEIIVLCEVTAEEIHKEDPSRPGPREIFDHMRVEGAVSFLRGFGADTLKALADEHGDQFRQDLRIWTGQGDPTVFFDLAKSQTVTHKLVRRLHRLLKGKYLGERIGEPEYRFNGQRIYKPSKNEDIDVKDDKLPPGAISNTP